MPIYPHRVTLKNSSLEIWQVQTFLYLLHSKLGFSCKVDQSIFFTSKLVVVLLLVGVKRSTICGPKALGNTIKQITSKSSNILPTNTSKNYINQILSIHTIGETKQYPHHPEIDISTKVDPLKKQYIHFPVPSFNFVFPGGIK